MGGFVQSGRFGAAGGGPPVTANRALWLDASDTSSITHTGGAVDQINDKSGNANHFTQTSTSRPTTNTVTLNSLNVLDMDGSNDHMVGPVLSTATSDFSMYVVVAPDAAPQAGTVALQNGDGGTTGYGVTLRSGNGTVVPAYLRGGIAWVDGVSASPSSGGHLLCLIRTSGGTWEFYFDGVLEVGGSSGVNTPATRSIIGVHTTGGGANFFNGGWAEGLFYTSAHGTTDRQSMESYFRTKWGTP